MTVVTGGGDRMKSDKGPGMLSALEICVDRRGCHLARLKQPLPACVRKPGCGLRRAMASLMWPRIERMLANCEMKDGLAAVPVQRGER